MKHFLFNMYCKVARLWQAEWLPPLVIWEPTFCCNFLCGFCGFYGPGGAKPDLKKELGFEQIEKMLTGLPKSVRHVGITGGEPFMKKDFDKILEHLNYLKKSYSITTNGFKLTEEVVTADYFCPTEVRISLHGPQKIHDKTVGIKGAFDKVCDNIKVLRRNQIHVLINCVITNENVDRMAYMHGLASELGCKIRFQHLEFLNDKEKCAHKTFTTCVFGEDLPVKYGFTSLSEQSARTLQDSVKEWGDGLFEPRIKAKHIMRYYRYESPDYVHNPYCFQPWGTARIDPYGNVYPCIDYYFGNLKNNSLKEVWQGEKANHFFDALKKCKLFPGCKRCCKL